MELARLRGKQLRYGSRAPLTEFISQDCEVLCHVRQRQRKRLVKARLEFSIIEASLRPLRRTRRRPQSCLTKLNQIVERPDTDSMRGAVASFPIYWHFGLKQ